MDAATEKKVIGTIYDVLYDVVTYSPAHNQPPISAPKTTFIQIAKDMPINPKDFSNAQSPSNPDGLVGASESFSRFVDAIPLPSADYASTGSVDLVYGQIIQGANATETPDPAQVAKYNEAHDYLYTNKKVGNSQVDSDDYFTYLAGQQAYANAVANYRSEYLKYDMKTPDGQKKWQAVEHPLRTARDQAWTRWRSANADEVESALQVMSTSINSMIRAVLDGDKKAYNDGSLGSVLGEGSNWHLSYAIPGEWCSDDVAASFSGVTITSGHLNQTHTSDFTAWSGGASWNAGLWSIGGGAGGNRLETHDHMDSDNFDLKFRIGVIQVRRPWFDAMLFRMNGWKLGAAAPKGAISSGSIGDAAGKLLPFVTTHFIVARDIAVSADWSEQDKSHIQSSVSGSASVGWGPFRASGSYTHTHVEDKFTSTFSGGTLNIPGIQVLGFVSTITPPSPPE